ncbi:MAG: hypothetical protein VW258_00535 [Thalassolituus sp.]
MNKLLTARVVSLSGMLLMALFCSACREDATHILRGKQPIPEVVSEKVSASSQKKEQEQDTTEPVIDSEMISATITDKEMYQPLKELIEDNKNNRQPLNLTLPTMSWEKQYGQISDQGVLPDVFRPITEDQRLNLSGKILWDESEEARELSVEDSIKGAEVELQFYLP